MLQCKAEAVLKTDEVEPKIKAIRLSQGADGFFLTMKKGQWPSLFGDDVMAVFSGPEKVAFYLKRLPEKRLVKRWELSQIDKKADTEKPSYFKKVSRKIS